MTWILSAALLAGVFVAVLIQVEDHLEHKRRIRRTMRLLERYSAYYVTNFKDPR